MDWNTIDRGQGYAVQMQPVEEHMLHAVRNDESVDLPILKDAFIKEGRIEFAPNYALTKFTPTQLHRGIAKASALAGEHATFATGLPTKPSKEGAVKSLATKYMPTRGKNVNKQLSALFHGLAYARRALKAEADRAQLELVIKAGGGYTAEGITLADGSARIYGDMMSAVKAWVRKTYGDNWYVDKVKKAQYLVEGMDKVQPYTE